MIARLEIDPVRFLRTLLNDPQWELLLRDALIAGPLPADSPIGRQEKDGCQSVLLLGPIQAGRVHIRAQHLSSADQRATLGGKLSPTQRAQLQQRLGLPSLPPALRQRIHDLLAR